MTDFINRLSHKVYTDFHRQVVIVVLHDHSTGECYNFEYNLRDAQSLCDWPSGVFDYCLGTARSSLAQMWRPQA